MQLFICALYTTLTAALGSRVVDRGLNLPPTQGTTRDGAFYPGLYQYDYSPDQVARAAHRAGFSSLRLAVNVETANNVDMLVKKHKAYIDAVGGRGVICMFDTSFTPGTNWPRAGNVTGKVDKVAQAWKSVHSVFASYGDNVMYEIFNEPWGYQANAAVYVKDMVDVVNAAGLPHNRVILAGLYGSADVQSVVRAGWPGYLAYHVYVFWLPEGQRTKEHFSKRIQQDLAGLSSRIFITEFGVGLDGLKADIDKDELKQDVVRYVDQKAVSADWHKEHPAGSDVGSICEKYPGNKWCKDRKKIALAQKSPNLGADVLAHTAGGDAGTVPAPGLQQKDTLSFLRGMRDALLVMKKQGAGVRGLYHWHGWHNGDTWDFWDAANARSSRMIQMMMTDQGEEGSAPKGVATISDPYSDDFVHDDQQVHMMVVRQLGEASPAKCPEQCGAKHCLTGNDQQIGGKGISSFGFCSWHCSKRFGDNRFCGVGVGYEEDDAIDCGGCANPPICSGLPCYTKSPKVRTISFLQKRPIQAN